VEPLCGTTMWNHYPQNGVDPVSGQRGPFGSGASGAKEDLGKKGRG